VNSLASGAAAAYTAENARLPVAEETFSQEVILRPKDLGVVVPISNRLLRDAAQNPDVEQLIREDLAEVMALRADLAFIEGPTGGAGPTGIINSGGLTNAPDLGANGRTPTFDDLKATVAALRAANAPFRSPGWVFNPRLISTLETIKDDVGRYLADTNLLTFDATGQGGTLLGYRFRTSGQIPITKTTGTSNDTSYVIFSSDWDTCWIGENQALEIDVSDSAPYSTDGTTWNSAWQQRQHVFRALASHDIGLVRPSFFTVLDGVRP
jgi:HK97 family phage major capsid protein